MTNKLNVIMKAITLLHREKELTLATNITTDSSAELVKTTLNSMANDRDNNLMGGDSTIITELKYLLKDMIDNPDNYDKITLVQDLKMILSEKDSLLKIVDKTIDVNMEAKDLKRTIVSLRNTLNNFFREQEIKTLLSKASYKINTNQLGDESVVDFTNNILTSLEALSIAAKTKDPGIMEELDISDVESIEKAMNDVQRLNNDEGKLLSGWDELNVMTGGGFRRGEQWVITALQHNYKSGFVQSLFTQLTTLNKPVMDDPTKKPLNLLISFEDDMHIIAEFMYKYLYFNEHGELPDLSTVTGKDVSKYVSSKLGKTGYHTKILRINPDEWTFKHLFNKILEFEADGYEIHTLVIDYLSKLPTTGCIKSGAMGTDVRDLFNKVRNFCSSKKILNITPHQLSTEALNLTRAGIKNKEFITEISNNNYYEGSKQIPQVADGEIYLCKGTINRKWHLFVGRGKHRNPKIIADEDKLFVLPFPKNAPIVENIEGGNNLRMDLLSVVQGEKSEDDFDF